MPSRIGDLVEVTDADTVVHLDGRPGRLAELVLTGDVKQSLASVLDAAAGDTGAGFLLVGHFGSGKSHFLAALAELLEDPRRALQLPHWDAGPKAAALEARPALGVTLPLVEYRAEAHLDDVAWRRAWQALGREPGPRSEDKNLTEDWDAVVDATRASGRGGLLLLIDELSEFLKAKRGPGLTEDLRFLQFLGEWARKRPVVVVGALQESLDEVSSISETELSRIRDRFPVRLSLSMRHVEDLVRGRLVRLREGAEAEIEQIYAALHRAFPSWAVGRERFLACYPVHPESLTLLDGLRFLFSQQRGVVDFICRQLREGWLERPADQLLGPDRVYDHFRFRLAERVETAKLAETVVPYYERAVTTLFEAEEDRELALRAVKLLALLSASPLERRRSARELAAMLLHRMSALDPAANVEYLQRAVLEPLVAHGAYVVARGDAYEVALEADAALTASRLVEQARAQLQADDRRIVETLLELGGSPSPALRESGRSRRQVQWQNTPRFVLLSAGRLPELHEDAVRELDSARERTGSELALVIVEPELDGADLAAAAQALVAPAPRIACWVPDALTAEESEFALELVSRQLVLHHAASEDRGDAGGLLQFLRRSADSDEARAREVVRRCYFQGRLIAADAPAVDLPVLAGRRFEDVLGSIAAPLLHALHPRHRDVQPHSELNGERQVLRLITVALAGPRLSVSRADSEGVRAQIDAFLVPLGVARKRGDAYHVTPDPSRSAAVAELLRLTSRGPVAAGELARALAEGPVGLTAPETLLLLNAAVLSGILEATKGRRPVPAPFVALAEVERLGPGELVAPELRPLVRQFGSVFGPGPHEPWDARVQQASWEAARAWLDARRDDITVVREGIRRLAESPLHSDLQLGGLPDDLARMEVLLSAADPGASPRDGLEGLLRAAGPPDELLASVGRVAAVARFCRTDLGPYAAAAAYVSDPALTIPDQPAYAELRAGRADAGARAAEVLTLAAGDRAREVLEAFDLFRRAYAAAYVMEHVTFYAEAGPEAALGVTGTPEYRALSVLSDVAPAGVPDDRARVDRALQAGTVRPCSRRVEAELALRPTCPCGFTLGTSPPRLDVRGLAATAARGVRQHLAELGEAEPRARLEQAARDLTSLGQGEVANDVTRLLGMAARPERADVTGLQHLLAGPARGVLRQVLRGAQVVVRRDLAALREDIAGRRYPRRRLLELVQAWVEGDGLAEGAVIEVEDSAEAGATPRPAAEGPTVEALRTRFPELAARLPAERAADAFWLGAWWAGREGPPDWLPARLVESPELLRQAASALAREAGPHSELADLDARVAPGSLLGDQVATALAVADSGLPELVAWLREERWLRHPVRVAAGELARRLAVEPHLAERVPGDVLAGHALLTEAEVAPLLALLGAARLLAGLAERLPGAGAAELVGDVYPAWAAPVPCLLSEVAAGWPVFGAPEDGLRAFEATAARLLGEAERAFAAAAGAGCPGCLRLWEVGDAVVAPLLREHGRVAVLLVDAMRADLWLRLREPLRAALPGRRLEERWAVSAAPTRTAEAVTALARGRSVAAGEIGEKALPQVFEHLGYQARTVVGIDRDARPEDVLDLWRAGPPLSVGVATGVDERIHHTPVDLAVLLSESVMALERRVLPALRALPASVPLVVMADHGFRENRSWGRGSKDRYAHGGESLAESVVPIAVLR